MSKSTSLSDLLNARKPADMSGRELGRKAGIGESTGTAYLNGRHPRRPSRDVLERIAQVLPVTVREMQAAAGIRPDTRTWEPPEEVHSLSIEMQDEISRMIRLIHQERGKGGSSVTTSEPQKKSEGGPGAHLSATRGFQDGLAADRQPGASMYEQMTANHDAIETDQEGPEFGA